MENIISVNNRIIYKSMDLSHSYKRIIFDYLTRRSDVFVNSD